MSVVALARDLGSTRHSILHVLDAHLEVVWGALVAFVVVVLLTPAVGGMARLIGAVDSPGGRRLNVRPIPRLGGLALFLGIFVPSLAFLPLGRETRGLLLGAAIAVTVGAIDDFRGLRWFEKLAGQLLAAAVPTWFGIWVDRFTFPFVGIHALPAWAGVPLTILWIVAIMNMVNFLDGLDGLASNFYPARIFMGDSGALLLGFVLAALSVQGLLKTAATVALFFPLLVLAVPIVDTTFVVARRLRHGEKVFEGDQAHLHHRFLRRGFSQPRAAVTIWAWCLSLAAAALATRFIPFRAHGVWHVWPTVGATAIGLVAIGISIYVVYVLEIVKVANPYHRRREERLRKSA